MGKHSAQREAFGDKRRKLYKREISEEWHTCHHSLIDSMVNAVSNILRNDWCCKKYLVNV